MANEFSSFEYEQPADYITPLEKSYADINQGFENAQQQIRDNDNQRIANAKILDRAINNAYKFSTTYAKYLEKQRDERDVQLRNDQRMFIHENGITFKDLNDYYNTKDAHNKEISFWESKAQEAEQNQQWDLANKYREITGQRELITKEILVRRQAANLKIDWDQHKSTVKINRGTPENPDWLTIDNATSAEETAQLFREFTVSRGLSQENLGGMRDEFLNETYFPEYDRQLKLISAEHANNAAKQDLTERQNEMSELLEVNALANNDSLGKTIVEKFGGKGTHKGFINNNATETRNWVKNELVKLVQNGVITAEQAKSALKYQFKSFATGKMTNISSWKEFDDFEELITTAETAQFASQAATQTNKATAFSLDVQNRINERGAPVTELEAVQIEQQFRAAFPGLAVPQYIKGLSLNTIEDRDDLEYVAAMEEKLAKGIKIETKDWINIKGDSELREKWRKIAASDVGQGLGSAPVANAHERIDAEIRDVLGMTMGTMDAKSPRYGTLKDNANALYAQIYRQSLGQFETNQQRHDYAITTVLDTIKLEKSNPGSTALSVRHRGSIQQSFAYKKKTALSAIHDSAAKGIKLWETEVLPGTEDDLARLVKYAENPAGNEIPPIYTIIANESVKGRTGWEIANAQYRAHTGKDLPQKPKPIQVLETKTPLVKYLVTRFPSRQNLQQAAAVDKGIDLSREEVTPGVLEQ